MCKEPERRRCIIHTGGVPCAGGACTIFHHENSVTKPLLSTILLHSYGTAACLLVNVNASSNARYHGPYSYTPLPPLSSSIPICTGDSGNSCFALLLPPASSFSRVALPPVSLVLLLEWVSVQCPSIQKPTPIFGRSLLSCLLAVGGLHVQLVLFAGGVGRVVAGLS